ncbi:MAG: hypothetical protein MJ168_09130 [Clostridia bacterium]|nr:hypothetical protein [Clostridia bacterium]
MKKILSIILAAVMLLTVLPIATFAEDENQSVINEIEIDFIYPTAGEPAYSDYFLVTTGCTVTEAHWFEASSDKFIDADSTFSAGKYYMEVTFDTEDEFEFGEEVNVIINGNDAVNVAANEDGTITAVAEFEIAEKEEQPSIFAKLLTNIKTIFLVIVRFFGELVGLK